MDISKQLDFEMDFESIGRGDNQTEILPEIEEPEEGPEYSPEKYELDFERFGLLYNVVNGPNQQIINDQGRLGDFEGLLVKALMSLETDQEFRDSVKLYAKFILEEEANG